MKKIIFTLALIASFKILAFEDTMLKVDVCSKLSSKVSNSLFSSDLNEASFENSSSVNIDLDYVKNMRIELEFKMKDYCKINLRGVSVGDFTQRFQTNCGVSCKTQSSKFKDPVFGENKIKRFAEKKCLAICNEAKNKLDIFMEGIEYGASITKNENANCSSSIYSSGRNIVKTKDIEPIVKEVESKSAIQK